MLGSKQVAATLAFIKPLAGIGGHGFSFSVATFRAGDGRIQNHLFARVAHDLRPLVFGVYTPLRAATRCPRPLSRASSPARNKICPCSNRPSRIGTSWQAPAGGPAIPSSPRPCCWWETHEMMTETRATTANIGSKVVTNTPSNWVRKPRPRVAPSEPRAGKQAAHPIADKITPSDPTFSDIAAILTVLLTQDKGCDGLSIRSQVKCVVVARVQPRLGVYQRTSRAWRSTK